MRYLTLVAALSFFAIFHGGVAYADSICLPRSTSNSTHVVGAIKTFPIPWPQPNYWVGVGYAASRDMTYGDNELRIVTTGEHYFNGQPETEEYTVNLRTFSTEHFSFSRGIINDAPSVVADKIYQTILRIWYAGYPASGGQVTDQISYREYFPGLDNMYTAARAARGEIALSPADRLPICE